MSAATPELAQRLSGSLEVRLLWNSDTDKLCVCVRDPSGDHFRLEVEPAEAMDVFHHPTPMRQRAAPGTARTTLSRP